MVDIQATSKFFKTNPLTVLTSCQLFPTPTPAVYIATLTYHSLHTLSAGLDEYRYTRNPAQRAKLPPKTCPNPKVLTIVQANIFSRQSHAMHHEQQKLSCSVLVDNAPLDEYKVEVNGNNVTCFIAAEEGKRYTVSLTNNAYEGNQRINYLSGHLYIDGRWMSGYSLRYQQPTLFEDVFTGNAYQSFTFGKLVTTFSGDAQPADAGVSKNHQLSSIVLKVWQARVTGVCPPTPVDVSRDDINEKSAKKSKVMCDRVTSRGKSPQQLKDHSQFERSLTCLSNRTSELLEAKEIIPMPVTQPTGSNDPQTRTQEILALAATLPTHKRDRILAALNDPSASSSSVSTDPDDCVMLPRKRQKPRFRKEDGIQVDLEAEGGPVVTRVPVKKEVEVVDLE
ncbi:hypothetical protein HK097_002693, partial [Rhizophlyctis rosea]